MSELIIGYLLGLFIATVAAIPTYRFQEKCIQHWFEDGTKWMNRYFDEVEKHRKAANN